MDVNFSAIACGICDYHCGCTCGAKWKLHVWTTDDELFVTMWHDM